MQESIEVMKSKIKVFNEKHPVGSAVIVVKDFGENVNTKVRCPAEILGGHTAVVWLDNISGAYSLDRVMT